MPFVTVIAIALGLALSLAGVGVSIAHEGEGKETLAVEPSSVTAGATVVVAGGGLEPDSDRVLVLAGADLTVDLGTVTTDGEGMFSTELTIPSHLPSGTYELRAIGDETLSVPLAVTAAAGGTAAPPAANDTRETVVDRDRSGTELGIILALTALIAIAGGLLVLRAERFRGRADA
jgi:hypothetical protein